MCVWVIRRSRKKNNKVMTTLGSGIASCRQRNAHKHTNSIRPGPSMYLTEWAAFDCVVHTLTHKRRGGNFGSSQHCELICYERVAFFTVPIPHFYRMWKYKNMKNTIRGYTFIMCISPWFSAFFRSLSLTLPLSKIWLYWCGVLVLQTT